MDVQTCLEKLKAAGVLAFATVDETGGPQIRSISAIHYEPDQMVFFTARGKAFCDELQNDGRVQVLGSPSDQEMIRLSARVTPIPDSEQLAWIDRIFAEMPFLWDIYPGDTRVQAGIVFAIRNADIEYMSLASKPIVRERFTLGEGNHSHWGYRIHPEKCIGCDRCLDVCPQNCIVPAEPYTIQQNHCLHCGNCVAVCPVGAIERG